MRVAKHSKLSRDTRSGVLVPSSGAKAPSRTAISVPAHAAIAFSKLDAGRRAHLLGRLLGALGPLALAVVGGGAFAKYLPNARWAIVPVSSDDAALTTSSQVHELVRYVEQSNPNFIEGVLTALMQDGLTVAALGATLAAIAVKRISDRHGSGHVAHQVMADWRSDCAPFAGIRTAALINCDDRLGAMAGSLGSKLSRLRRPE